MTTREPLLWEILGIDKSYNQQIVDRAYEKLTSSKRSSKQIHLAWKILRDPYFGSAYNHYRSVQKIFEAGFFEDRAKLNYDRCREDVNWLTTPIEKVKNQISIKSRQKNKNNKPYIVLLATGAFSPIHEGHIDMLDVARIELSRRGYQIVGGFLSPSHDGYVSVKSGGEAAFAAPYRVELCRQAVKHSEWLMVDPWESMHVDFDVTYTDVISHLEKYLNYHIKADKPIQVVYIFGSDNAWFARTFIKQGHCFCVRRRNHENKIADFEQENPEFDRERIIFSRNYSGEIDLSSSIIRRDHKNFSNELIKKIYCQYREIGKDKKKNKREVTYAIRNDLAWATDLWKKPEYRNLSVETTKFLKKFSTLWLKNINNDVFKRLNCVNASMFFLDYQEQVALAKKFKQGTTISLDPVCIGDYNFNISRRFATSDAQYTAEGMGPRPGHPPIKEQLKMIPPGHYFILEDDIASGYTFNYVVQLLKKHKIIVDDYLVLSRISKKHFVDKNSSPKKQKLPVFDIIDTRDFLVGSKDGGLAVLLPNGEIARAPYLLPYVSLTSRASIPPDVVLGLSKRLWELNEEFFARSKPAIKLAETDASFQSLMKYIGFKPSDSMEKICRWHKDRLHYHIYEKK